MNKFLLESLRCPFCAGDFNLIKSDGFSDDWKFAVLECYCGRYPVVAGIPILRKGVIGARGETTEMISRFILSDNNRQALLAATMPPAPRSPTLAPEWMQKLPSIRGLGRLQSALGKFALSHWHEEAERFLTAPLNGVTASDFFDFHFLRSGKKKGQYHHVMHRFGQPRHLVGLSLMTLIDAPTKPVLDFGCGFGHLTCHLPRRVGGQPIVGADREFMRLYIAKHFFAPNVHYVCCDGDTSLPFLDEFFSVTYSSDTLFMVTNKAICSREIQRVTSKSGLIIVTGIRNGLVEKEKYPGTMPYPIYARLFEDMPQRVLTHTDILDRYIQKQGPSLTRSSDKDALDRDPWFSIVATNRDGFFQDYAGFPDWPHAEGVLELNPLYQQEGKQNGANDKLYRHSFPSSWYEQEDGDCRKYEPEVVSIPSQILSDLSVRKRTLEMEDFIAKCVIVGVPEKFH